MFKPPDPTLSCTTVIVGCFLKTVSACGICTYSEQDTCREPSVATQQLRGDRSCEPSFWLLMNSNVYCNSHACPICVWLRSSHKASQPILLYKNFRSSSISCLWRSSLVTRSSALPDGCQPRPDATLTEPEPVPVKALSSSAGGRLRLPFEDVFNRYFC